MTAVDAVYTAVHPLLPEQMAGLGRLYENYGIRKITLDDEARQIRVEFDATRLNRAAVAARLRRQGITLQQDFMLASA